MRFKGVMDHHKDLQRRRGIKARSVRRKLLAVSSHPRLTVFRSNRYIYAQVVDDRAGRTLAAASSREASLKTAAEGVKGKTAVAARVGEEIARRAKEAGVDKVLFDRRHYKFHGRIKALADAARKAGLVF